MTRLIPAFLIVLVGLFNATAAGQTPAADPTRAQVRKSIEHTAADPSQRSSIATPSIDFSAELAKDKKTATAKAGFALREAFTTEVGFTGAFAEDDDRSNLSSVRGLDTGSKGWIGLTYKKYPLVSDLAALRLICWQYLWSSGQGLFDSNSGCQESTLPDESFSERLAAATPRASLRGLCQRFNRATTAEPTTTPGIDCDAPNVQGTLDAQLAALGERATLSSRAQANRPGAMLLDLCNDYRRSIGRPPTGDVCKVDELPETSWREQFDAALKSASTDQMKIDICNEYRAARGLAPASTGDCASAAGSDPLFTQSFRERYSAAYHWGVTPIVAVRYEVNHSQFKYLDDQLAPQEPHHDSSTFIAEVGLLTSGGTLATAGYRYADVWKAKPTVSVCRPMAGTAAATCTQAIVGAPTQKKTHAFEVQARRFLTTSVAAQIVATMDQDKLWQVDVPIYFIPDKDSKGLTGGIVASYQSEHKRWDVSVFVGSKFSLYD